jgi:hypothetical protein
MIIALFTLEIKMIEMNSILGQQQLLAPCGLSEQ